MTDLLDEVKTAFESAKPDRVEEAQGPVVVQQVDENLPAGTSGMQNYFKDRMLIVTRRGYRYFAGGAMPTSAEQLIDTTAEVMLAPTVAATMVAFTAGVMVGHRNDHLVRLYYHSNAVDHIFSDSTVMEASKSMAVGFAEDEEVREYFTNYTKGAVRFLSQVSGFEKSPDPARVWDVWMLTGAATSTASYLAGHRLGTSWYERDVLDGILIATEENTDGPVEHQPDDH